MVATRSMSKSTKKSETEIAPTHRVGRGESKKEASRWRYKTIKDDAFSIFVMKDYLSRYFGNHPRPTGGVIPVEAFRGAKSEWFNMSDTDKEEWIEYAKKKKTEGANLFSIHCECLPTYPRFVG